ncbi:MAG: hypothetical protein QM535_14465 [Limnohabitans sp.]|nr:hypothetical protein [Limnohabitans sp.]
MKNSKFDLRHIALILITFSTYNLSAQINTVNLSGRFNDPNFVNVNGNVGIGVAEPAAKLDVVGAVKIFDGSQGAGKVLTSDATGLASWRAPITATVISSTQIIIPANTSYYGNFPVNNGKLVSAGIQNLGFKTKVYPTQLYIPNTSTVFFQIDNLNSSPVIILIWGVVDNASATFGSIWGHGTIPL